MMDLTCCFYGAMWTETAQRTVDGLYAELPVACVLEDV